MTKRERERRLDSAFQSVGNALSMVQTTRRMDDNDKINLDTEISDAEKELKAVRESLWPTKPHESTETRW